MPPRTPLKSRAISRLSCRFELCLFPFVPIFVFRFAAIKSRNTGFLSFLHFVSAGRKSSSAACYIHVIFMLYYCLAIFCGRNFIIIFKQFIKIRQAGYADRFAYVRKRVVRDRKKICRVLYSKFVYIIGHRHAEYVFEFF